MPTDRTPERRALVRFVEEAIEKSAPTVEDVHKSIAQLPVKILEENDLLRTPAKEVRRLQDHTIGASSPRRLMPYWRLIRGMTDAQDHAMFKVPRPKRQP